MSDFDELGRVYFQRWYKNGKLSREDDQPALIELSEGDGHPILQEWYAEGVLSRSNDLPSSVVSSEESGRVLQQSWSLEGLLGRDSDKPAIVDHREDGTLAKMEWYTGGKLHRSSGPAVIRFGPDGKTIVETRSFRFGNPLAGPSLPQLT